MAVTVIPGPVDKLNQGIMAGQKIVATMTQLKALKDENDMRERQLKINEETAVFTQQALSSRSKASDAAANLANIRATKLEDMLAADIEGKEAQTDAQRAETSRKTAAALVDVNDDSLSIEESLELAAASMEIDGVVSNPANLNATGMLIRGAHSQAAAALDVQHRRSDAYAIRAASGAIGTLPPEYEALLMGGTDNIRQLNKEILVGERSNKFMPKHLQTDIGALERKRDEQQQFMLDIGAAFRSGGIGSRQGGDSRLPTINNDEAGREAYNKLDSGDRFIDPNGDVQTKP